MAVQFTSNLDIIVKTIDGNAPKACESVEELAVEAIQYRMLYGYHTPHGKDGHTEIVDTGRLYDSITGDHEKKDAHSWLIRIGASPEAGRKENVDYAVFVHEGTSRLEARRFITDTLFDSGMIDRIGETFAENLTLDDSQQPQP